MPSFQFILPFTFLSPLFALIPSTYPKHDVSRLQLCSKDLYHIPYPSAPSSSKVPTKSAFPTMVFSYSLMGDIILEPPETLHTFRHTRIWILKLSDSSIAGSISPNDLSASMAWSLLTTRLPQHYLPSLAPVASHFEFALDFFTLIFLWLVDRVVFPSRMCTSQWVCERTGLELSMQFL
mgnify:CR=1 FL=1